MYSCMGWPTVSTERSTCWTFLKPSMDSSISPYEWMLASSGWSVLLFPVLFPVERRDGRPAQRTRSALHPILNPCR